MFVNRVTRFEKIRKDLPYTSCGERLIDVYKLTYADDGTEELVVCGKKDIYEEIQSHADSVDVHKIIERCTITGNMDELYKTEAFYGDLSEMPSNRAEALKMLAEAHNIWDKLPVDVKKKFDNDVNKFFSSAFTDEWINKLTIPQEPKEENKDGDVNE